MDSETKTIILTLLSILISLFAIYFNEYKLIILIFFVISTIGYILFSYLKKIEKNEKEINNLKQAFKRTEDLIELRAEIKFLKEKIK